LTCAGVDSSKRLSLTLQQPTPTETYPTISYASEQGYNTVSHAALKSFQYSEKSNSSLSNTNVSPREETSAESKDTIPSSLPSPQNSGHINKEAYYTANLISRKPINPSTEYYAFTNEPAPANVTPKIAPLGLDKGPVNITPPSVGSSANPPAPAAQMPIGSATTLRKAVPEPLAKAEINDFGWDSFSTANKKSKNAIENTVQVGRAEDHELEAVWASFRNKRKKKAAGAVEGDVKIKVSSSQIDISPDQAYATYEHEGIADDGELSFPRGAIISNIVSSPFDVRSVD